MCLPFLIKQPILHLIQANHIEILDKFHQFAVAFFVHYMYNISFLIHYFDGL
jgi:hypothetical protein